MKDYNREIAMICNVCGNDQFETLEEEKSSIVRHKCSCCGKVFTKDELIAENNELIEANVDEMAEEVIKDFEKKLKKMFK